MALNFTILDTEHDKIFHAAIAGIPEGSRKDCDRAACATRQGLGRSGAELPKNGDRLRLCGSDCSGMGFRPHASIVHIPQISLVPRRLQRRAQFQAERTLSRTALTAVFGATNTSSSYPLFSHPYK